MTTPITADHPALLSAAARTASATETSSAAAPAALGPDAMGPDAMGPDAMGPDAMGPDAMGPDAMGKDMFLKLLVAQLKYQNPMSPMEGNEFLVQSAQFTMLEKLQEIASGAAEQSALSGLQTSAGLLGRKVTWGDGNGGEASGIVTGSRIHAGKAVLLVGASEVPLAAVREVHQN